MLARRTARDHDTRVAHRHEFSASHRDLHDHGFMNSIRIIYLTAAAPPIRIS